MVAPNLKYRENIGRHKKITMADMVFVSTYFFMILMLTKLVLHMFWLQIDWIKRLISQFNTEAYFLQFQSNQRLSTARIRPDRLCHVSVLKSITCLKGHRAGVALYGRMRTAFFRKDINFLTCFLPFDVDKCTIT